MTRRRLAPALRAYARFAPGHHLMLLFNIIYAKATTLPALRTPLTAPGGASHFANHLVAHVDCTAQARGPIQGKMAKILIPVFSIFRGLGGFWQKSKNDLQGFKNFPDHFQKFPLPIN